MIGFQLHHETDKRGEIKSHLYRSNPIPIPMMATYFNAGASEIHSDNLQTLYLMNPIYSGTPLAPSEIQGFHYNLTGAGDLGSPAGFRRPQGLSLSLNDSPAKKVMSPEKQSGILGSKYMRVAQQLLDEAVNVGKEMKMADSGREKAKEALVSDDDGLKKEGFVVAELSTAQRQELQMKKAKLLNMLDEVEQRYREYHKQMQAVVSSLEEAAGLGSAKSYTALALHTISKQFRCLKDAISSQIKETGRSLGEEEEGKRESRSRLRLVDQQMRQQKAMMQQLGVMHQQHHNAWRPQRGLPEKAVSVLRAWLFEHFLHPYPKDSDKQMLAKQTGLTRSQVSNWFINARVRLWKPMVEEMYLEETKGVKQQNDTKDHNDNNDNPNNDSTHTSNSTPTHLQSPRIPQNPNQINDIPNSTIISPPPALESFSTGMESSKRQRSNTFIVDIQNNSPNIILSMDHQINGTHHGGFGPNYNPVGQIGSRFNSEYHHHHHQLGQSHYNHSGNAVSLTLGLPHCENLLSSFSGDHQQNFMPEFVGGGSGGGYDGDDIQNRKRFAGQVMSNFVA